MKLNHIKYHIKFLVLILLFIQSGGLLYSQIITAGTISSFAGSVNNSSISINYSVGEIAIKTISNSTNSITQGFLQPKFIGSTGVIEINNDSDVSIFPNPFLDYILIKSTIQVNWEIFDSSGKSILIGDTDRIETNQMASGIYFIELFCDKGSNRKTIKLIKN